MNLSSSGRNTNSCRFLVKYLTEAKNMGQVARELKEINWDVVSASVEDLPTYLVEIPKEELEEVVEEIGKFQELPEFLKMVDNVANS